MKKKIYKLKKDLKYQDSSDNSFITYINKRKLQKALDSREKRFTHYAKKYKRMNDWVLALWLLGFYYLVIGLIVLLSKCGA